MILSIVNGLLGSGTCRPRCPEGSDNLAVCPACRTGISARGPSVRVRRRVAMRRRAGPAGRACQRIARPLGEMRALRAAVGRRSHGTVGRTLRRCLLDRLAIGAILIGLVEHSIAVRALVRLRRLLLRLLLLRFLLLRNADRRHADSAWRARCGTAHAVVVCDALRAAM